MNKALIKVGVPIDSYGVGTDLISAKPVAAIPGIYKLVEDRGGARMKLSPEKRSEPGKKQVFRQLGADGKYAKDIVALHTEHIPGIPLLTLAVKKGRRVGLRPALEQIRAYSLAEVARLPNKLKGIAVPSRYPLETAPALKALINTLMKQGGQSMNQMGQSVPK